MGGRKYSKDEKIIVLYLRRLHLIQQAREREALDDRRELTRNLKLPNGQPLRLFVFGDAMTSSKGDTPKDGRGFHQNGGEDLFIQSRLLAYQGLFWLFA